MKYKLLKRNMSTSLDYVAEEKNITQEEFLKDKSDLRLMMETLNLNIESITERPKPYITTYVLFGRNYYGKLDNMDVELIIGYIKKGLEEDKGKIAYILRKNAYWMV